MLTSKKRLSESLNFQNSQIHPIYVWEAPSVTLRVLRIILLIWNYNDGDRLIGHSTTLDALFPVVGEGPYS